MVPVTRMMGGAVLLCRGYGVLRIAALPLLACLPGQPFSPFRHAHGVNSASAAREKSCGSHPHNVVLTMWCSQGDARNGARKSLGRLPVRGTPYAVRSNMESTQAFIQSIHHSPWGWATLSPLWGKCGELAAMLASCLFSFGTQFAKLVRLLRMIRRSGLVRPTPGATNCPLGPSQASPPASLGSLCLGFAAVLACPLPLTLLLLIGGWPPWPFHSS